MQILQEFWKDVQENYKMFISVEWKCRIVLDKIDFNFSFLASE